LKEQVKRLNNNRDEIRDVKLSIEKMSITISDINTKQMQMQEMKETIKGLKEEIRSMRGEA
jgi:hypothetical protein